MTGHFLMFNEMLKTYNEPLSHELMKRYHYKLKSGVFEDIANGYPIGEYKNRRNIVSDITTALPEDVHARMTALLDEYNAADKHDLHGLAKFHADYEAIHPFQDGNGRTGRLILFKECLKNDIIPFVVNDSRKAEYYHALNTAQTKQDYSPLERFFREEQAEYRKQVEAGIGFAVKDGHITLFAVHGEEYLPALRCPFHGIAVRAEIAGAEIVQLFGYFQIDKNGVELMPCKIRKSLFKNTFIDHTPKQFQTGLRFIIEYLNIVFASALGGIYFPAMLCILQRIAHIKPHIVAYT